MEERAVFERFHEALELEPQPGAYERFRVAFITPPAAAKRRRPVLRLRFTRMSLRVAAAVAVVAIAIALVAGYVAAHRVTSQLPATHTQKAVPSPASGPAMDPAVRLPNDLPKDIPVYPGARPTFFGGDSSFGTTYYTLRWETTDSIDQAYVWYQTHLGQGDWTVTSKTVGTTKDTISFTRKSKSGCLGDLVISQRYPGITAMDMTVCG